MKTILFKYILAFLILTVPACDERECCDEGEPGSDLIGTWLLFERGYSPGSGYIVEDVSPTPPQTMTLFRNGEFTSNIAGLEKMKYFLLLQDGDQLVLALYPNSPGPGDQEVDRLDHSYTVTFDDGNNVRLGFRYCIEGCHMAFRRTG